MERLQQDLRMLEHLRPQYARNFRCLGPQCEDNCCRAWEVAVDRESYQRYERTPSLRPLLQENFTQITEGETEDRYAIIKFTSSSTCPFLSPDRLCGLQQQYGDNYLPPVCASYPRNAHRVDGLMEYPLSLSCIEAARQVLLNPHLMPRPESGPSAYAKFLKMPDQAVSQDPQRFRYFWEVRELCLLLVQDRSYLLWQRLFLLGAFCKRLGEIVGARQFGLVPKLLHDYVEIIASGKLRADMESIPVCTSAQVKMLMEGALGHLHQRQPGLCRIQEHLQDFLQGIGCQPEAELELCTRNYVEAHTHYYAPFMEENPHLLENYLINHIFRVVFPFGPVPAKIFERPQREYLQMCLEFAVIKGLLIGIAGYYKDAFTLDRAVSLIQAFVKAIEHDRKIGEIINWNGLSDPTSIAALLKN